MIGRRMALAAIFGVAFGFWLAWTRMTDAQQIIDALLFRRPYLWLMFATGVATTAVGLQVLRRFGARTWVGREAIAWPTVLPQRRHVVGSVLFGAGWAIAGTCPGPIAAQLGLGRLSALFTLGGLFLGIALADRAIAWLSVGTVASPCAGEASEESA